MEDGQCHRVNFVLGSLSVDPMMSDKDMIRELWVDAIACILHQKRLLLEEEFISMSQPFQFPKLVAVKLMRLGRHEIAGRFLRTISGLKQPPTLSFHSKILCPLTSIEKKQHID